MKLKKINQLLKGVAIGLCFAPCVTYAAQQEMLWGKVDDYAALKNFSLTQPPTIAPGLHLPQSLSKEKMTVNVLQFTKGDIDYAKRSHDRYNQYYQGLPVFGSELIYHVTANNVTTVTGSVINGIEKDIPNLNAKISLEQATTIALGTNVKTSNIKAEKIIFFDPNISSKAMLAYHVSYFNQTANGPALPTYIIDANSGKILKDWDALPSVEDGKGLGGVQFRKEYQLGQFRSGVNALGMFNQTHATSTICTISNNLFRVINLKNLTEQQLGYELPVSSANEASHSLVPFAYYCTSPNLNDNGYAPVNSGISPVNDTTYFVQQTYNMLTKQYKVLTPIGSQLPIRVYTHVGSFDNAFACDPACMQGTGPQQLVFGNGATMFSPLTEGDVVAHEFGHLVTGNFSKLNYSDQPGGMNEAFSDMTGMAINSYMRNQLGYTWYWNGVDWNTGTSITKTGLPLRYFDTPTWDGMSIDNAANFRPGMNPHLSSGVYNKAFYLLSTTPGWSVDKAYQVMLDANMYYWNANSQFSSAACGVAQAATNRGLSAQAVKNAFQQVGVSTAGCARLKV